ncbi:MAG: DsbA family protein [Acidimicrobiia bacterium]|nr:DsbA family protein [Acidimicrobiia bacterium]
MDLEFVYVGDPMCSWCWGFAPVLERMQEVYDVPLRVVVGGLRPGPEAEELDDRLARFLGHHWEQVEEASGQPFDAAFLERRDGWRYDTEVPAIAVVAMRELNEPQTLQFHSHLQRAFYAEGFDITDPAVYPDLIADFDVDADKFTELFASDEMKKRAWADFAESRSLGVAGFPALLVRDGEEWAVLTRGFAPAGRLLPALSDYLLNRYADAGEALFCEPGTVC